VSLSLLRNLFKIMEKVAEIFLTGKSDIIDGEAIVLTFEGKPVIGGKLLIKPLRGYQLPMNLAAITRKQADGSYSLEPLGEWIAPIQAAQILGIHESSILRLLQWTRQDGREFKPVLESRRPTPFRILIKLSSVLDHLKNTSEDMEFWTSCTTNANAVQREDLTTGSAKENGRKCRFD
jgi:hypothetical protein